jgi:hypothetical protein
MATADNPLRTATGTRCPECGRRAVIAGICRACGDSQIAVPPTGASALVEERVHTPSNNLVTHRTAELVNTNPFEPARQREPQLATLQPTGFNRPEVRGRVVIVRQASNEPMDFDPWRWIAIPVWGLVLLISPIAIPIIVWQSFGFLPALGVAACSLLVLRFMFSDRLLQSWHLTAALNGRNVVEPMPVTMLRLRLQDGREVQMRVKGQLIGGTVIEGDRIVAAGTWRSGVLHARRIHCERTGAMITPRQPRSRGLALTGLCVLLAGALWLYVAGIPWVTDQAQSFRASLQQRVQTSNTQHRYRP